MYDGNGTYIPPSCIGALCGLIVKAAIMYGAAYGIMEVVRWIA